MGHIIPTGDSQNVAPKPFAIVPIPSLLGRAPSKRSYYDAGRRTKNRNSVTSESGKIDNRPGDCNVEANLRQISVTVSVRLSANLNQSDYGQQHDQIPTPSNHQIWFLFSERDNAGSN